MNVRFSKSTLVLLVGTLCSRIFMHMSIPFLAIYLTQTLAFSAVEAGYIIGIHSFAVILSSIVVPRLTKSIDVQVILYAVPLIWGIIMFSFLFYYKFSCFIPFKWVLLCSL